MKFKFIRRTHCLGIFSVLTATATIALAACSSPQISTTDDGILKMSTLTADPFNNVSLVNPYFSTTTIDVNLFKTIYSPLFNYQNVGRWEVDRNGQTIKSRSLEYVFQGAKSVSFLDEKNSELKNYTASKTDRSSGKFSGTRLSELQNYVSNKNSKKIKIAINNEIPWVNKDGKVMQYLSAQDYIAAFKMFINGAKIGLNRNSYLIDLAGFDLEKTLSDPLNKGDQYLYLTISESDRSAIIFSVMAQQSFFPMPHTNPLIKPLVNLDTTHENKIVTPERPLYLVKSSNNRIAVRIDLSLSNMVYGWGSELRTNPNFWSSGSYYVSHTSLQDITYKISPQLFRAAPWLLSDSGKIDTNGNVTGQIKGAIIYYGKIFNTAELIFMGFVTGELDYAPISSDPNIRRLVFDRYGRQNFNYEFAKPEYPKTQGYHSYNTMPYNEDGTLKNNITASFANFVNQFSTPNSIKVRELLLSLINFPKIYTIINGQGQYDMLFNVVPYNSLAFPTITKSGKIETLEYSEAYKNNYKVKLLNPYDENGKDLTETTSTNASSSPDTSMKGKQEEIQATSLFPLPFQTYIDDINKNSSSDLLTSWAQYTEKLKELQTALMNLGYSTQKPLEMTLDINYGGGQPAPPVVLAYYNRIKKAINDVGSGLIKFDFNNNTRARVTDIYNNQSTEIGWSFWAPDFPLAETWLTIPYGYTNPKSNTEVQTAMKDGKLFDKFTNFKGEETTIYSHGAIPQSSWSNLWPWLFSEMTKQEAKPWMKNLLQTLKDNNIFADQTNPTVNGYDSNTKLVIVLTNWSLKHDYNRLMLNNFVNKTYSFLPFDTPSSSPYATNLFLVNPHYNQGLSFYNGNDFREWNYYANAKDNPRVQAVLAAKKNN